MKSQNTKVFFRYETEEVDEQVPVMEGNKVKREKGKKVFILTGNKKSITKLDGKIEAIMINSNSGEEIARREVLPRHGDLPNKILGRKYVFKKLMTKALDENLIPRQEVGELWKSFGTICKQPSQKLAY